jgi:uncharacterized membrane protein
MDELNPLEAPSLQVRVGRLFFALAVLASGILQLVTGHFVRLLPTPPGRSLPPEWLACLFGALLALIGIALLVRRVVLLAALTLGAILLALFLAFCLPVLVKDPWTGFRWTNPLKTLQLLGGAILIGGLREGRAQGDGALDRSMRWAPRLLLGAFLAICGMEHFAYTDFVGTLIPSWIPAHTFWTWFAGVALIAGGVGLIVPKTARLAATMSGIMVFMWVFLVHIPLAIGLHSATETAGVFEALATSGVAFMLAGTHVWRTTAGGG